MGAHEVAMNAFAQIVAVEDLARVLGQGHQIALAQSVLAQPGQRVQSPLGKSSPPLGASRIASGAVSSGFRRLARQRGPVGRQLFQSGRPASRLVERLNATTAAAGRLVVVNPRAAPTGTVLVDNVSSHTRTADLSVRAITAATGWSVTATAARVTSAGSAAPEPSGGVLPAEVGPIPRWRGDPDSPFWLNQSDLEAYPDSPDFPTDPHKYQEMPGQLPRGGGARHHVHQPAQRAQ